MSKFKIAFSVCVAVWFILNIGSYFTGPPARVGVSGRHSIGFPFPFRVENVTYTVSGPVISPIRNQPWIALASFALWCSLSYGFARWVDGSGAAWWRAKCSGPGRQNEQPGA
jgi:hypothetical protein